MSVLSRIRRGLRQDQDRDEDRDDRVGQSPAGRQHDECSDQRADRSQEIAQDVEIGAAGVEVVFPMAVQKAESDGVDQKPQKRHQQKQSTLDRSGILHPVYRLDHDHSRDDEQHRPIHQGREDFESQVAVGLGVIGGTARHAGGEEAQAQRPDIGQHVPGIRQQRQRAAEPSTHRLHHHEAAGEQQDNPQPLDRGTDREVFGLQVGAVGAGSHGVKSSRLDGSAARRQVIQRTRGEVSLGGEPSSVLSA